MNVAHTPETNQSNERRAVAVLIDHVDHLGTSYETELRAAFRAACMAHDLDLHIVVGRVLESPDPWTQPHNEVYRLLNGAWADGVIVMRAGLAAHCGSEGIARFCNAYRPLPLCSVGEEVPGVPSIIVDNGLGMRAVVEHLVVEHGCRRVAFIGGPRGNPEADARLSVYKAVLDRHGLQFDQDLVAFGDFTIPSGNTAALTLLDRGVSFDGLVGANDGMALGAMATLVERGLQIPRDVRAGGFDDVVLSRLSSPPLTTARQPLRRMAELAIQLIVDQLAGKPARLSTSFAVELVTRQSCGCRAPSAFSSMLATLPANGSPSPIPRAFEAQAAEAGAFLQVLHDMLLELEGQHSPQEGFLSAISLLRDETSGAVTSSRPSFWDSVRHVIAQANARTLVRQNLDVKVSYRSLLKCGEHLSNAIDSVTLKRALADEIPRLGIKDILIAIFSDGAHSELDLLFGLQDGKPITRPRSRENATEWLRNTYRSNLRLQASLMLALTFETECLGIVIFDLTSRIGVYDVLREQISLALKDLALHEQIVQSAALHERSVQERRAATERMNALSVLAGGVAHDLNSALAPVVVLPDLIQRELEDLGLDDDDSERLRSYVEDIKSAGRRAAETIKDLMTLGKQGQTPKKLLDLNRVIASCLMGEPSLAAEREAGRLDVSVKLHSKPLFIQASQHHLERAVSNLVRNAAEAIVGPGGIAVHTSHACIVDPASGYEIVAAGDYALVSVSDTGNGIPSNELDRVFEPFYTTKRSRDENGRGLGLAIVHGVVKEHNGYLDVRSTTGKGTTFILYFPIANQGA